MKGGYLTSYKKTSKNSKKKNNIKKVLSNRDLFKSYGTYQTYKTLTRKKSRRSVRFLKKFARKNTQKRSVLI